MTFHFYTCAPYNHFMESAEHISNLSLLDLQYVYLHSQQCGISFYSIFILILCSWISSAVG